MRRIAGRMLGLVVAAGMTWGVLAALGPVSSKTSSGPPRADVFGIPDLVRYCRSSVAVNSEPRVPLGEVDWECASMSERTRRVDFDELCAQQYGKAAVAVFEPPGSASSWICRRGPSGYPAFDRGSAWETTWTVPDGYEGVVTMTIDGPMRPFQLEIDRRYRRMLHDPLGGLGGRDRYAIAVSAGDEIVVRADPSLEISFVVGEPQVSGRVRDLRLGWLRSSS